MIATHLKNIKSLKNRLDIGLTVTPRSFLTIVVQYRVKAIAKLKSEIKLRQSDETVPTRIYLRINSKNKY